MLLLGKPKPLKQSDARSRSLDLHFVAPLMPLVQSRTIPSRGTGLMPPAPRPQSTAPVGSTGTGPRHRAKNTSLLIKIERDS